MQDYALDCDTFLVSFLHTFGATLANSAIVAHLKPLVLCTSPIHLFIYATYHSPEIGPKPLSLDPTVNTSYCPQVLVEIKAFGQMFHLAMFERDELFVNKKLVTTNN